MERLRFVDGVERVIQNRAPDDISDADWSAYLHLRKRMDAITRPHIVVDTQGDLEKANRKIARAASL